MGDELRFLSFSLSVRSKQASQHQRSKRSMVSMPVIGTDGGRGRSRERKTIASHRRQPAPSEQGVCEVLSLRGCMKKVCLQNFTPGL